MRARATMTREVISIPPELSLQIAWGIMLEFRVRHLPVVEDRKLIGIISDRDVLRHGRMVAGELDATFDSVEVVMSRAPLTCSVQSSVSWLAEQMIGKKIDALPVVNNENHLVGLVTSTDLLALLIDEDEAKIIPFDFQLKKANKEGQVA